MWYTARVTTLTVWYMMKKPIGIDQRDGLRSEEQLHR